MKLVFATHNKNKFKEVKAMLPHSIELLSLEDIGLHTEIEETANTIEGNAALKANYVHNKFGYDCFADDTGLEVPVLNNDPGVYSARYAGNDANAQNNITKLLENLKDETDRKARFKTAIALTLKGSEVMFIGICEGEITYEPSGKGGFGYDPIFKPEGFNETFAQMSLSQKSEIGHRGKAMRQLIEYLSE